MTPLLAAGAASVAGEIVSRVANSLVSRGAHSHSPASTGARVFDQVLNRTSHAMREQGRMEEARAALSQMPEVARTLATQPAGSVNSIEVRADGSVSLGTSRGPVEVALSLESRAVGRQIFLNVASAGGAADLGGGLNGQLGAVTSSSPLMGASAVSSVPSVVIPSVGSR